MSVKLSAIIVAAGNSNRMGFDKIMTILGDRPLVLHTLERVQATGRVSEVILVVRHDILADVTTMVEPWQSFTPIRVVQGGASRQDSVAAGLNAISPEAEYVMIHDAARIFVTQELVDSVLDAAIQFGSATCGTPCSDSLKKANPDATIAQTIDRSDVWQMQTPQIFRLDILHACYGQALDSGLVFTDDTAIVEYGGYPVKLVPYKGVNFKVTTPTDWKLALAHMYLNEPDCVPGQQLRKQIHDINNHLTPMMGYAYLILKELKEGPTGKKYAANIQSASERCQEAALEMQKLVRQLFPRKEEIELQSHTPE